MIRPLRLAVAAMILAPTVVLCLDTDPASLIRKLARPAPASVDFAEVRYSPLLKEPLIVAGQLSYQGPGNLDRRVTQPYKEDTEIRGESVRVVREGESTRSFGLRRSPELRGLLAGFSALLSGDAATLEGVFETALAPEGDGWKLDMTPIDPHLRKRLRQIAIHGHNDTPRCFAIMNADGGMSVMLLGDAAGPPLAKDVSQDAVLDRCRGGASRT